MQVRVKTDYRGFSFHFIAATACHPFNPQNICSVLGFLGFFFLNHLRIFKISVTQLHVLSHMLKYIHIAFSNIWSEYF